MNNVVMAKPEAGQTFELLYEQHKKPLERYLLRLVGDREVAYDLCQDLFFRAWSAGQVSQPWLYRVAKNLVYDYFRHSRRYEFLPLPESEAVELSVPGHEDLVCELLIVQEVLAEMSPQYRACLVRSAEGLTQREIAAELGIKEKTVSANISRGYVQVRLYKARQEGCRDLNKTNSASCIHVILILQNTIVVVLARSRGPVNPR